MEKEKFLYESVYEDLKKKISQGNLKPDERLKPENELVEEYQVSAITIKKALSMLADEGVIKRIRGKGSFVTDVPAEPEPVLETEADGKEIKGIIGVIFEHISSSFGLEMMYALDRQAQNAGYHLFPCFSYGDREMETEQIRYLRSLGVKGLLVMPVHGRHYNTEILKLVIDEFPTVLIDKAMEGVPLDSVRSAGEQGTKQLVDYLYKKGKQKIALVTVDEHDTSSLIERKRGFYKGMEERGLPLQEECIMPYMNYEDSFAVYGDIYRKLLRKYLREHGKQLDGIVCSEYGVAMQVNLILGEENLKESIEVCCIDENYIGPDQYQMTHIKQDEEKIAECAMEVLLRKIQGETMEQKDYLIPGIFVSGK